MNRIRTLIVDDEPLARENLMIRLRDVDDFQVIAECANGEEALAAVIAHSPDVVFLDIQMPDMSGFEVIDRLTPEKMPVIVFVTAFDRYALEAFRVHALDYLLKPFEEERFAETLRLCRARLAESEAPVPAGESLCQLSGSILADSHRHDTILDRLVIKTRGRVLFLKTENIDWVEANGDYSRIHTEGCTYLLRRTMNDMEVRLNNASFARTNRSAIVNLDRIQELRPLSRGEYEVRLRSGEAIKLTRIYREKLEQRLGDRL